MAQTQHELVLKARTGDTDAFSSLITLHERTALSIAYGLLRDAHLAGDAVQDAFLRAWQQLGSLQDPLRFSAWLGQIVRNAAMDLLRKRSAKSAQATALPEQLPHHGEASPLEGMERQEVSQAVAQAMKQLDEVSRTAVALRYFDNKPSREIAAQLGISPAAVDMRISRARELLRTVLSDRVGMSAGKAKGHGGPESEGVQ